MNNKFDGEKTTITVKEVKRQFDQETGDLRGIVFIDTTDTWFKFNKVKKDGGETAAYRSFTEDEVKAGDVVEIGYKVVDTTREGVKMKYPANYISFFKKLENTVVMNPNGTYKKGSAPSLDEDLPF